MTRAATLDRVCEIVSEVSGVSLPMSNKAIDQDLGISGGDVSDLIEALRREFGPVVDDIPWSRFTSQVERTSPFLPIVLFWYLLSWPFRGRFMPDSTLERLAVEHVALVIGQGHWIEPTP